MAKKKAKKKKVVGKNGLGVIEAWVKLFKDNAKAKASDELISKAIKANFPGRDSAIFDHVQAVRGRYNRGILTKGVVPKVKSVRYEGKGKVLTPRRKKK